MAVSRRSTRSLAKPAAPDKLEPTCCTSQVNHTDNAFREPSRGGAGVSSPELRGGRRPPLRSDPRRLDPPASDDTGIRRPIDVNLLRISRDHLEAARELAVTGSGIRTLARASARA